MRFRRLKQAGTWALDLATAALAAIPLCPLLYGSRVYPPFFVSYRTGSGYWSELSEAMLGASLSIVVLYWIRVWALSRRWLRREWREAIIVTPRKPAEEIACRIGRPLAVTLISVVALYGVALAFDFSNAGLKEIPKTRWANLFLRSAHLLAVATIIAESWIVLPTLACLPAPERWLRAAWRFALWIALGVLGSLGLEGTPFTAHAIQYLGYDFIERPYLALALLSAAWSAAILVALPAKWLRLQAIYSVVEPGSEGALAFRPWSASARSQWQRRLGFWGRVALIPAILFSMREWLWPTDSLRPPLDPFESAKHLFDEPDSERKLALLDEAERLMPRNPDVRWTRGETLMLSDRIPEAIIQFSRWIGMQKALSEKLEGYRLIASLQINLGDAAGAETTCASALGLMDSASDSQTAWDLEKLREKRSDLTRYRAEAQRGLGHPDEALRLIEQAIADDPERGRAYASKARILFALDRDEEALALLEARIRFYEAKGPYDFDVYFLREAGIVLIGVGRCGAALEMLNKPNARYDAESRLLFALASKRLGLESEAREAVNEYRRRIEDERRPLEIRYIETRLRRRLPEDVRDEFDALLVGARAEDAPPGPGQFAR